MGARHGPFTVLELVGKNAVRLDFPENMRAHLVVLVENTKKRKQQPKDIGLAIPERPVPMPDIDGFWLQEVDSILVH